MIIFIVGLILGGFIGFVYKTEITSLIESVKNILNKQYLHLIQLTLCRYCLTNYRSLYMAKKHKTADELIYQIKDLLDDLQLKLDPEDSYDDESEDDLDIDDDEDEDN